MQAEVLTALKLGGVRHAPGTVLDLTDEQVAGLPPGTVKCVVPPPPPPAPPRSEKTPEERADALRIAQERVAAATAKE
jgi:hypothetical protein